jgi:hypothetical protein
LFLEDQHMNTQTSIKQNAGTPTVRKLRELEMPNPSMDTPAVSNIKHHGVVVVIGANGSGKSRLGAWLENPSVFSGHSLGKPRTGYRISAQRSLSLPENADRVEATQARTRLEHGGDPAGGASRVSGDPVTGTLNDYTPLLNLLFAQDMREALEYRNVGKKTGDPGHPPESVLEKVQRLWEQIFPERKLEIGDHKISAKPVVAGPGYSASSLSDGERVGFYLIGHALLAPADSRIIIDEPELHLHESIQGTLWNALETARMDCTFVYITHDLAFAATRSGAPRILLRDYRAPTATGNNGHWDWELAPSGLGFPDDLTLRILGSRRPLLFVEGQSGSLDESVFEILFPKRYVVASNNWQTVNRSVRAFRDHGKLHHLDAMGIIDRDDREAAEIALLKEKHVYVLPVAGVEALLALPKIVLAVLGGAGIPENERATRMDDAMKRVVKAFAAVRDKAVADRARYRVSGYLKITAEGNSRNEFRAAVSSALAAVNPDGEYDASAKIIDDALKQNTLSERYSATLEVFRNKSVLHEIGAALGISADEYIGFANDILRGDSELRTEIGSLILPAEEQAHAQQ